MKKTIIIIGIILLVAIPAAVYFYKKSKSEEEEEIDLNQLLTKKTPNGSPVQTDAFPLKMGSKGARVKHLQEMLNTFAYEKLTTDGIFGSKTKDAVLRWFKTDTVSEKQYNELNQKALYSVASSKIN